MGKSGRWVWMKSRGTVIYNTNHEPQYVVCINYVYTWVFSQSQASVLHVSIQPITSPSFTREYSANHKPQFSTWVFSQSQTSVLHVSIQQIRVSFTREYSTNHKPQFYTWVFSQSQTSVLHVSIQPITTLSSTREYSANHNPQFYTWVFNQSSRAPSQHTLDTKLHWYSYWLKIGPCGPELIWLYKKKKTIPILKVFVTLVSLLLR